MMQSNFCLVLYSAWHTGASGCCCSASHTTQTKAVQLRRQRAPGTQGSWSTLRDPGAPGCVLHAKGNQIFQIVLGGFSCEGEGWGLGFLELTQAL